MAERDGRRLIRVAKVGWATVTWPGGGDAFTPPPDELIAAVAAAPGDDAPRLKVAAWHEARKEPRGRLIKLQCARAPVEQEVAELLNEYGPRWCFWLVESTGCVAEHEGGYPGVDYLLPLAEWPWRFTRGFLDRVSLLLGRDHDRWKRAVPLFAAEPLIADLTLRLDGDKAPDSPGLESLLTAALKLPLTRLVFTGGVYPLTRQVMDDDAKGMMDWHYETVGEERRGPEVGALLASQPLPPFLETVGVTRSGLSASELAPLLSAPSLAGVTGLELSGNPLGDEGAARIVGSARPFRTLALRDTNLGDEAAHTLANSPLLVESLAALDLGENRFTEAGKALLLERYGERVRLY